MAPLESVFTDVWLYPPHILSPSPAVVGRLLADQPDVSPIVVSDRLLLWHETTADTVELSVMEDRFPPVAPMRQLDDTPVWYTEAVIDADGAIEYRYEVRSGGRKRSVLDAHNPNRAANPFGSNSVGLGPEYAAPRWLEIDAPEGTVEMLSIVSKTWGRERHHQVYLPHDLQPVRTYPLLIMHDGPEYVEFAGLAKCLDVLISEGALPPLIALLHAPEGRNHAYSDNPSHVAHVADELLPHLRERFRIGAIVAGGASLGGIASISLSLRRKGMVDALMLQSASLVTALGGRFKRGRMFAPVTRFLPEVLASPSTLPGRVVMSCGTYDGLVEEHRKLLPALSAGIAGLSYEEINAGHHWRCWRDRLEPDLTAVFDGLDAT